MLSEIAGESIVWLSATGRERGDVATRWLCPGSSLDLFLLDDGQTTLVHQRTRSRCEGHYPVIELFLVFHEKGQRDRRIEAFLSDEESLVSVTLDRRVPQVQHAQWPAHLLLRINYGKVLDACPVDLHLNALTMTVRTHQGHIAAHVLRIPTGIHVRVLQARLIKLQEVCVHRYVGWHFASCYTFNLLRLERDIG